MFNNVDQMVADAMKNQGRPQQPQAIDPVTPIVIEELVKHSRQFACFVVEYIIDGDDENDTIVDTLYDICFECLRPLPRALTLDGVRSIFFNLYFAQNHGAVFDYMCSKHETTKYQISEKGIKAFTAAYNTFTDAIYKHFVIEKKASGSIFVDLINALAEAIRD